MLPTLSSQSPLVAGIDSTDPSYYTVADPPVLTALIVITAAGAAGLLAGCVLWRAAQLSGLWNLFAGVLLGLVAVMIAFLIGYLMVKASPPIP